MTFQKDIYNYLIINKPKKPESKMLPGLFVDFPAMGGKVLNEVID